jgi:hypothetical protein
MLLLCPPLLSNFAIFYVSHKCSDLSPSWLILGINYKLLIFFAMMNFKNQVNSPQPEDQKEIKINLKFYDEEAKKSERKARIT